MILKILFFLFILQQYLTLSKCDESTMFIDHIYSNYSDDQEMMSFQSFNQIVNKLDFLNINKSDNYSCYSSYDLFNIFNISNGIKREDFFKLSTALIWHLITPECKSYSFNLENDSELCENSKTYLYGIIAIVVTWAISTINVFILMRIEKKNRSKNGSSFLISALNALAIGILLGDTLLHIVPSSLGLHSHEHEHNHDHDHEHHDDHFRKPYLRSLSNQSDQAQTLWKMSASLATIFGLYLFEVLLGHDHDHDHEHGHEKIHPTTQVESFVEEKIPIPNKKFNLKKIQPNGWVAFVGDLIHKLADGFAIGAAFSESLSLGFSTSLAILCHEIPHELGDYAVLKSAGFNNLTIFILNTTCSFFCLVGFLVIAIAEPSETFRQWMFAITIGVFLYLALVIMLPRLKSVFEKKHNSKRNIKQIVIVINAFILGWATMLVLAYFEEDIQFELPGTRC